MLNLLLFILLALTVGFYLYRTFPIINNDMVYVSVLILIAVMSCCYRVENFQDAIIPIDEQNQLDSVDPNSNNLDVANMDVSTDNDDDIAPKQEPKINLSKYSFIKQNYLEDPDSENTSVFLTTIRDGVIMYRGCKLEPSEECSQYDIVTGIENNINTDPESAKFYAYMLNILEEGKVPQPKDIANYIKVETAASN